MSAPAHALCADSHHDPGASRAARHQSRQTLRKEDHDHVEVLLCRRPGLLSRARRRFGSRADRGTVHAVIRDRQALTVKLDHPNSFGEKATAGVSAVRLPEAASCHATGTAQRCAPLSCSPGRRTSDGGIGMRTQTRVPVHIAVLCHASGAHLAGGDPERPASHARTRHRHRLRLRHHHHRRRTAPIRP